MPLNLSLNVVIPAAGFVQNALAGTPAEFLSRASILSVYANADQVGDTLSLTLNQGGDTQQPIPAGYNIPVAEGAGQGPVVPDDVVLNQYGVPASSRLSLGIVGTAADVVRVKIFVSP